jgi:hypothetical protein
MAREVMDFPIITGGPGEPTMKDFLKYTTTSMKKIVLEEKLFKTWYHGRVVLIGNGKCYTYFLERLRTFAFAIFIELTSSPILVLFLFFLQHATRFVGLLLESDFSGLKFMCTCFGLKLTQNLSIPCNYCR